MSGYNTSQYQDYRHYYLQSMGIVLYDAKPEAVSDAQVTHPSVPQQPVAAKPAPVNTKPAVSRPVIAKPVEAKPAPQPVQAPKVEPESVKPASTALSMLVASAMAGDVCQLLGVEVKDIQSLGGNAFKLGAVIWQFDEAATDCKLEHGKLVTMSLDKLDTVAAKKALWQVLAAIVEVSDD